MAILVTSKAPAGLYVKVEFDERHDIDLHLYNDAAEEVASSGAFNPAPVAVTGPVDFSAGGNGGESWESIPGFEAAPCQGFTAESVAYASPGTPVKMTIWLGEIVPPAE